ncbi:MAG: transketolase [Clostridiales bacterium]|nr:transketolase [Clostridiales bacterium]
MKLEKRVVNNIRTLASDVVANAKSGHTGIVLSSAPILYTLFARHYNNSPKCTNSLLRDRFVMSAGHGSALLYTILHLFGYGITLKDLQNFRKLGSVTSGHPELNVKYGIECTTGPLGQGVATAVGMAIAQKRLQRYNRPDCKLFDNKVYTLVGDGCIMEGVSFEALSLAGSLNLDNLIVLYDSNNNTLDSDTKNTLNIDIKQYITSLGFDYYLVKNGNDTSAIDRAISRAKMSKKPSFIEVKTILGFASDVAGMHESHGLVMDNAQLSKLRLNLGVKTKLFGIENDVKDYLKNMVKNNKFDIVSEAKIAEYKNKYMSDYLDLMKELYTDFSEATCAEIAEIKSTESTRNIAGVVLDTLSKKNPTILGGNADLSSCTKAIIKDSGNITKTDFDNRNILFGVREFGMACISNGIALSGYKPFCGTFMVFSDYLRSAIRSSAIMNLPVVYILSHDSVAVGEDGPTHQPIEQIDSFRVMPNVNVFRPYNTEEIVMAYNKAFSSTTTPSVISLTRQPINIIATPKQELQNVEMGGYVIAKETLKLEKVLVATGSEVALALEIKELLEKKHKVGCRVVSIPCAEVYMAQTAKYRDSVIPASARIDKYCIEAGSCKTLCGVVPGVARNIGINEYGISAPMADVYKYFKFTATDIVNDIMK